MKICSKCGKNKGLSCFSKDKNRKDGHNTWCRQCCNKADKERRVKNRKSKEILPIGLKRCSKCGENRELGKFGKRKVSRDGLRSHCKACRKQYYEENKEKILERQGQYNGENKEKRAAYEKQWRYENKEKVTKQKNKWHREHKEKIAEYKRRWYEENKEEIMTYREENREKINERYRQRMLADPVFKLSCRVRGLIRGSFKNQGFKKFSKAVEILDCNFKYFHNYLTGTFCINYGRLPNKNDKLHIDHIIPLAMAKTEKDVINLCHHGNLQWLLKDDNLKKGDKLGWIVGDK